MLAATKAQRPPVARHGSGRSGRARSRGITNTTSSAITSRKRLPHQHRRLWLLPVAASSDDSSSSNSSRPPSDRQLAATDMLSQQAALIQQLQEQNALLLRLYEQAQAQNVELLRQLVTLQSQQPAPAPAPAPPPTQPAQQQHQQQPVAPEPDKPVPKVETASPRRVSAAAVATAAAAPAAPAAAAAPPPQSKSPQEAATALFDLLLSIQQQQQVGAESAVFPADDKLAAVCGPLLAFLLEQGGSPGQLLKAPWQRRELLTTAAALQMQSQQGGSSQRQQPLGGLWQLLALFAQHVLEEAAPGTLPAQEGVATLIALTTLQLPVRPDWLAALLKQLNALSSTGSSSSGKASSRRGSGSSGRGGRGGRPGPWFCAPAEAVQFMRALACCEQPLSLQQCREVCGYLTAQGRLQHLAPSDLVELVTLLAHHHQAQQGDSSSSSSAREFQQLVGACGAAALPLLLPAADELSGAEAQALVSGIARLHATQPLAPLTPAEQTGAARVLDKAAEQILLLSTQEAGDAELQHQVLACAWLLSALDPPAVTALPASAHTQVFQLIQQHVVQQGHYMLASDAACLFCAAAGLAASRDAAVLPPGLQNVLVQLLAGAQADLARVSAAELVRLPGLAAAVELQLDAPLFVEAVQQRLNALRAASSSSAAADVLAASQQGAGPVELLSAACWLLVDHLAPDQAREQGCMSLNGLQQRVDASGVPRGVFEAAAAVVTPSLVERLSSSQVCDLVHAFVAAGLFHLLSSATQAALWQQLRKQHALSGLTPAQHGALLMVASVQHMAEAARAKQEQGADNRRGGFFGSAHANSSALLKAVLQASQPNLAAWPPSSVAQAIASVGNLLAATSEWAPASLAAVVRTWHVAAAAALQPAVQQRGFLPPAICVQLLLGCNRIATGCSMGMQEIAPLPPTEDAVVQDVLAACVMELSQPEAQAQLTPALTVEALMGCSRQPGATRELGAQLLAALQPHLASMPLDTLNGVPEALARWPAERRPHPTQAWLDSFLAATLPSLTAAVPPRTGMDQPLQLQQVPDTTTSEGVAPVSPALLAELSFCLAFLGWLPGRGWQEELYRLAAAQLHDFDHDTAAHLLQAMAMWRQAARLGSSADGQPIIISSSGDAPGSLLVYPAPLVDGLVFVAASGLSRLGETAALMLPTSLKVLQWPPDEELISHITGTYTALLSKAQSQRALVAKQLAAAQQQSSKLSAARRLQEKQQQLAMVTQAEQMLESLVEAWQQLLGSSRPSGGGAPVQQLQKQPVAVEKEEDNGQEDEAGMLFAEMLAAAGVGGAAAGDQDDGALDAEFELLS